MRKPKFQMGELASVDVATSEKRKAGFIVGVKLTDQKDPADDRKTRQTYGYQLSGHTDWWFEDALIDHQITKTSSSL